MIDKDADDLTDADIKAYRNIDNLTNESPWDLDKLNAELAEMDLTGFDFDIDIPDSEPESADVTEDYFDAVLPKEPDTRRGDLYIIGTHRLLCGDSTDPDDLARLMDGATADLLLTDPPYGVNYEDKIDFINRFHDKANINRRKDMQHIESDGNKMEAGELINRAFMAADVYMQPGTPFYIWYAGINQDVFMQAIQAAGWTPKQILIWVKNQFALGLSDYQWKHEPCIYGWKPGKKRYFTDSRAESTVIDDKIDVKKLKKDEAISLLQQLLADKRETTVIYEDKPTSSNYHPTSKPLRLMARLIRNSSRRGAVILDIFAGSGSTMLAAEQLGRRSYNMELDPKYCDAILQRYAEFTGRDDIIRIRDGQREPYTPPDPVTP